MRKLYLTRNSHPSAAILTTGSDGRRRPPSPPANLLLGLVLVSSVFLSEGLGGGRLTAQEAPAAEQTPAAAQAPAAEQAPTEVVYPLNVAVGPDSELTIVDLDLPGLWQVPQEGGQPSLLYLGSPLMRKAMNRPRCVVALEDGSVLVGDSASRDIYRIESASTELKGLTDGYVGIPMCLAVDPAGEMVYVGDAEKRALFKFPLAGGAPELVARVNARGLSFDAAGRLWAVTPDDAAVVTIDDQGTVKEVVSGRPFQYPGGIAHVGEFAYVTDGYGRTIWKVTADGTTEAWFQGGPLKHPVGIAADGDSLLVADPHSKQIFRFKLVAEPTAEPLLP